MEENKMNKEQKWKELRDKASEKVHKVENCRNLVEKIHTNSIYIQSNYRYAHLLDLNARGTHLSDPVYQKLHRYHLKNDVYQRTISYIGDALTRIGNRTMTQEEYEIFENASDKTLRDLDRDLDERLKNLTKKIGKIRSPSGGAYWAYGPFYLNRRLRTKNDTPNEGNG